MASTLVVEFFGLPGSGKSTLVRHVHGLLRAQGIPVDDGTSLRHFIAQYSKAGRGSLIAKNISAIFPFALPAVCGVRSLSKPSLGRLGKYVAHEVYLRSLLRAAPLSRQRESDILLLDQGLIQNAYSLKLTAKGWREDLVINSIQVASSTHPRDFIYLRAAPPVAAQRILARKDGRSRLDRLSKPAMLQVLEDQATFFDVVFTTLTEHSDVNVAVLEIDATVALSVNSDVIGSWIGQRHREI